MTIPSDTSTSETPKAPKAPSRRSRSDEASLLASAGGRFSWVRPLALAALAFLALGSWSLSSSVGSAPDADYHLTSAWCQSFGGNVCEVNEEGNGVLVPEAMVEAIACVAQRPQQSAGCQPLLEGSDPRQTYYGQNNVIRNLYPDGYYSVMHMFVNPTNVEQSVIGMRLFNSALFVVGVLAVWLALPRRLKTPYLWMWAVTMVPLGAFIVASANPSGWAVLAVGSAWIVFLGFLETKGPRSYLLAGLFLALTVLAANARIDALLYLALSSALAMGLSPTSPRDILKKVWAPAIVAVFIGAWLIIVRGNFGTLFTGFGARKEYYKDPLPWSNLYGQTEIDGFDWALLWSNTWDVPGLMSGSFGSWPWGALGWLDTIMPQVVSVSVLSVILLIAYLSLRDATWVKRTTVIFLVLLLWAIPLYLLQLGGFRAGEQFQPRYLLPAVIALVGYLLVTKTGIPLLKDRFGRLAAVVAISLAHAIALHTNFRRYATGMNYQALDLNQPSEWWWFSLPEWLSPNLVWVVGAAAFSVAVWSIVYRKSEAELEYSAPSTGGTTPSEPTGSESGSRNPASEDSGSAPEEPAEDYSATNLR